MSREAERWLEKAAEDLRVAEVLRKEHGLENAIAFHAQQSIEKALKASIVFNHQRLLRTHDLVRLREMVSELTLTGAQEQVLEDLTALYTGSRYPSEFGLLPAGLPTQAQCTAFIELAKTINARVMDDISGKDHKNLD